MSKPGLALVWLAGPISGNGCFNQALDASNPYKTGLIVQPIIGVLSDNCSMSFGRRKPFIALGGVLMILGIIPVAYSRDIAGIVSTDLDNNVDSQPM
jgi:solute carrier family 45 protein 1/2/4